MKSFPSSTRFKKPWRTYQERVLSDLEGKIQDTHLHIIALTATPPMTPLQQNRKGTPHSVEWWMLKYLFLS